MVENTKATDRNADRHFSIGFMITHPIKSEAEITAILGMRPSHARSVGAQVTTPTGRQLAGYYPDTRWSLYVEHRVVDQLFAAIVEDFLRSLKDYGPVLSDIRKTGGMAYVVIKFLGGHFGDLLPTSVLIKLAEMNLDLGIEVFDVAQNSRDPYIWVHEDDD